MAEAYTQKSMAPMCRAEKVVENARCHHLKPEPINQVRSSRLILHIRVIYENAAMVTSRHVKKIKTTKDDPASTQNV